MQTDSGGSRYDNPISPRKLFSQLSLPDFKDVKGMLTELGYIAEDKPLLPGISIRAASVDKLASLAVECFGRLQAPRSLAITYIIVLSRQ